MRAEVVERLWSFTPGESGAWLHTLSWTSADQCRLVKLCYSVPFDGGHCEADRNSHALDNSMVQQFEVLEGLAGLLRVSS